MINGLRADLLYENFQSNVAMPFSAMVTAIMKVPSYTEVECCTKTIKNFPIVYLNVETFNNDLRNLNLAITDNLVDIPLCTKCKKSKFTRTYGHQIFVEVLVYRILMN